MNGLRKHTGTHRRFIYLLVFGLFNWGCTAQIVSSFKSTGKADSKTLAQTNLLGSSVYSGESMANFLFQISSAAGSGTPASYSASLAAFQDAGCATPASGTLSVTSANPLVSSSLTPSFTGVSYLATSGFEEKIFVKTSIPALKLAACSSGVQILQHFNAGSGFRIFQPGGLGASGSSNASKDDASFQVAVDSKDRVIHAGYSFSPGGKREMAIWRFLPSGDSDLSFGNAGAYIYHLNGTGAAGASAGSQFDGASAVAVDSQDRIVAGGCSNNASGLLENTLWRVLPDGTLDSNFGSGGVALTQNNGAGPAGGVSNRTDCIQALAIDSQKRILASGFFRNAAGGYPVTLLRFTENGLLDPTFGNSGIAIFQESGNGVNGLLNNSAKSDGASALAIDSQGRIVLGGYTRNASGRTEVAVLRFLANGSIDTSFGTAGASSYLPNGLGLPKQTTTTNMISCIAWQSMPVTASFSMLQATILLVT